MPVCIRMHQESEEAFQMEITSGHYMAQKIKTSTAKLCSYITVLWPNIILLLQWSRKDEVCGFLFCLWIFPLFGWKDNKRTLIIINVCVYINIYINLGSLHPGMQHKDFRSTVSRMKYLPVVETKWIRSTMWATFNSTITFNKNVFGEFPQFDWLKKGCR